MFSKNLPLIYLKDLDIKNTKNSILCLDNSFFHIFNMTVENILNDEDRIEKIEDKLEIIFPKFDEDNFVLRFELVKKNKKSEDLIVYLLDLEYLNNYLIIDDMKDYNFISIIPSFFICREFKNCENLFNFDISKQFLVISEYTNNNIKEILTFQLNSFEDNEQETSGINDTYDIINMYLNKLPLDAQLMFTGNNINLDYLELDNKNYFSFNCDKLDFSKYLNFLPDTLKNKFSFYYINTLYFFIILVSSLILLLSSLLLFYNISASEEELENLNSVELRLEDEINQIKNEMVEVQKEINELENNFEKEEFVNFKISSFLEKISSLCPKEIKINSIEYDDNKIFNIEGSCLKIDFIVNFLENISNVKDFKIINYDYIIKNENKIEFKIEIKYLGE